VHALIRAEAGRLGVRQRRVPDDEIVERCILALVNEGARILEEGIAGTPSDIDVIWCNGYGFPRHRGGPMFHADTIGLGAVLAAIQDIAKRAGERYWQPAPLIVSLAARQSSFAAWQATGETACG
jgi:3-hydroxyacyl-CoA dehydrogenase